MARGIRIGRRVVKGRFILFILGAVAVLLWLCLPKGPGGGAQETSAVSGSLEMEISGPGLCIWQEEVYTAPQGQRVEYYASDGMQVATGDTIADIFPTEGDSAVLDQLNALREDISHYQISILAAEHTEALAVLNTQIEAAAAAIQAAVIDADTHAVAEGETQLGTLMDERQQWLDEHTDPDEYLLGLYQQEATLTQAMADEMIPIIAPADGYVSFSVDGWENRLSPDLIDYMTPSDMDEWLGTQDNQTAVASPASDVPFFKIIYDQQWYLALQADSAQGLYAGDGVILRWNDGSEANAAEIVRVAEGQTHDLIILRPEGAPTHARYGYVRLIKSSEGIKVPVSALYEENGRDYIRITYNDKPTAIEVNIEALGDAYAIVRAAGDVEGLAPGVDVYVWD